MFPEDWLQQFRQMYPSRDGGQGWGKVKRLVPAHIARGAEWAEILEAAKRYRIWCGRKAITSTSYVMQAQRFVGPDEIWLEWATYDLRDPKVIAEDAERISLTMRAIELGFRECDFSDGIRPVRYAIEREEAKRLAAQAAQKGVELPKLRVVGK